MSRHRPALLLLLLPILIGTATAQRSQFQRGFSSSQGGFSQGPNQRAPPPPQQQQQRSLSCPEKNGRFAASGQCDSYVECIDGVGEEKLCPDGLLFNPRALFTYPCQYPVDVDCEGRSALQPAQATEDCPHQFGYFRIGDERNCGQFMNCVDGRGYSFDCPLGLAFDPDKLRCDWPDQVAACDAEAFLGFTCPPLAEGVAESFRFYRDPNDCQRYFICVNGRPRLYSCGEGNAFSLETGACDGEENVTDCGVSAQRGSRPNAFGASQSYQPQASFQQPAVRPAPAKKVSFNQDSRGKKSFQEFQRAPAQKTSFLQPQPQPQISNFQQPSSTQQPPFQQFSATQRPAFQQFSSTQRTSFQQPFSSQRSAFQQPSSTLSPFQQPSPTPSQFKQLTFGEPEFQPYQQRAQPFTNQRG